MAKKLITEEIIPLKYNKNSIWYKSKHWELYNGEVLLRAGGTFDELDYEKVYKYFKDKGLV